MHIQYCAGDVEKFPSYNPYVTVILRIKFYGGFVVFIVLLYILPVHELSRIPIDKYGFEPFFVYFKFNALNEPVKFYV